MPRPEDNETFDEALARTLSSTIPAFKTYGNDPILGCVNTPEEYSDPTIQPNELDGSGKYGFSGGDKFVPQDPIWRTTAMEREKRLMKNDQYSNSESMWQDQSACESNAINQPNHSVRDTGAYKRKLSELIEISDDEVPTLNNKRRKNNENFSSPRHTQPHQTSSSYTPGYQQNVPSSGPRTSTSWNRPGQQKTIACTPRGGPATSSSRGDRLGTPTSNQGYQNTNSFNSRGGFGMPSSRGNGLGTSTSHPAYQNMNPITPRGGLGMSPSSINGRGDSSHHHLGPNCPSSHVFHRSDQSNPTPSSVHGQVGVNRSAVGFQSYAQEGMYVEKVWQGPFVTPYRSDRHPAELLSKSHTSNPYREEGDRSGNAAISHTSSQYVAEGYPTSVPSKYQTSNPFTAQGHRAETPSDLLNPNPNGALSYSSGIPSTSHTSTQSKTQGRHTDTPPNSTFSEKYRAQGYRPGVSSNSRVLNQHGTHGGRPDIPFTSRTLSPYEAQGYCPEVPPNSHSLKEYGGREYPPGNPPNSRTTNPQRAEEYDLSARSIYNTSAPYQGKSYASGPFSNSRSDPDHSVQYNPHQNQLERSIEASASSNGKEPATSKRLHNIQEHYSTPYLYNVSKTNTPLPSSNLPYSSGQGRIVTSKRKYNDMMDNSGSENDGMVWPVAKRQKATSPGTASDTSACSQASQPRKRPVSLKIHQVAANAMKALEQKNLLNHSNSGTIPLEKKVNTEEEADNSPLVIDEKKVTREEPAGWENLWEGVLDGTNIVNDEEVEEIRREPACSAQPVVHSSADKSSGVNPSVTTLPLDGPSNVNLPAANSLTVNTSAVKSPAISSLVTSLPEENRLQEAKSEGLLIKRAGFVPDGRRDFRYVEPLSGQEQAIITLAIECTRSDYFHITGKEPPKTSSEESYAKQFGELQEALEAHWKGSGRCPNLMCAQPWRADFGEEDLPELGPWDDQFQEFAGVRDGIDLSDAAFEYYMDPFDGGTLFGFGPRVSDKVEEDSGTEWVSGKDDAAADITSITDIQHFDTGNDQKLPADEKESNDADSLVGEKILSANIEGGQKPEESQNEKSQMHPQDASGDSADKSINELPTLENLTGGLSYEEFLSNEFVPRTEEEIRAMYSP